MDVTQAKIDEWIKLIQLVELQDVLDDIQMSIRVRINSNLNKNIFKLLLHLCNTTDECNKSEETGRQLAELTKLLYSLLIDIPNDHNFVKCLYKIVRHLISLHMYEDAADICCYLQPSKLYDPQNGTTELVTKILALWHSEVCKIYLSLATESVNEAKYHNFKNVITYEVRMMQIAHRNCTKPLIMAISSYLDKMAMIDKKENKYFKDFFKCMLEHLNRARLNLEDDEKHIVYSYILHIICHMCRPNITDLEPTRKAVSELFSNFKNLLAEDDECHQCFQQFQRLCATLLVPIEKFTDNSAKSIKSIISCNLKFAQKYGYDGALKSNALGITEILDLIFIYMEKRVETEQCLVNKFLDTGILLEMMNLLVHMDADVFYMKEPLVKCKWCLDKGCMVRKNLYNAAVMKCRCISLICKFSRKSLPREICVLAKKILEQNVGSIIREMREGGCKRWIQLWNNCRSFIYNIGIVCEHDDHKESAQLFELLCYCIFQLQEVDSNPENFKGLESSITFALHKLSVIYYNNGLYRSAMTVCALHGFLTYDDPSTKAFRMWANIKRHAPEQVTKLTMIQCLENDKDQIKDKMHFLVDTSKCNLTELYLREIRGLLKEEISFTDCLSTLLEEFQALKPSKVLYAQVLQLLGYYLLNSGYDSSIVKYYRQAVSDLNRDAFDPLGVACLEANLHLVTFLEELHAMNKQTWMEMQDTKFALYPFKLPELRETRSPNIVPAYTMINVKKDSSLETILQKCLRDWTKLFESDIDEIVKYLEPEILLDTLVTVGEYCRLHRYEHCESEIWKLTYGLAARMHDHYRIIYATSRSVSLRQIDSDWIATAKECAMKHRESEDENLTRSIAILWITLADYYFERGEYEDANQLLAKARDLSGISFVVNASVHVLRLDTIIRNINLYEDDNTPHQEYDSYIAESLCAMRNLHRELLTEKCESQMEYLFNYDVLFTVTINLSMRVNSLLSFRGISADLVRLLKTAQSLGAVMRVTELLKSLCYIDLSRSQLDECEVKLQAMEHILDIETFEVSMSARVESLRAPTSIHLAMVTPTKIVEPVRDLPQHDGSPVLSKKVFVPPKFTSHSNCQCYKCCNVSYQYLVFATVHIRAQLYASQSQDVRNQSLAIEHFHGVFELAQRLFLGGRISVLSKKRSLLSEIDAKCPTTWQERFYITDYVQLLIDFCYFLKMRGKSRQQDNTVSDITDLAIHVCRVYKLESHPVYVSAKELALDNDLQPLLTSSDPLSFMIPQPRDVNVGNYTAAPVAPIICVTPSVDNRVKKPLSVRRRRSPKISKINMIWNDDNDDDDDDEGSSIARSTKSRKKLVKRKILEEYLSDDAGSGTEKDSVPEETEKEQLKNRQNAVSGSRRTATPIRDSSRRDASPMLGASSSEPRSLRPRHAKQFSNSEVCDRRTRSSLKILLPKKLM